MKKTTEINFLRFSDAFALAVHALVIAASDEETCFSVSDMAEQMRASGAHLSKVMQRLAKAGFVRSVSGPGGGFRLARRAGDIPLLDVYECIEGIRPGPACLFTRPVCGDKKDCAFRKLFTEVNGQLFDFFSKKTIGDLI